LDIDALACHSGVRGHAPKSPKAQRVCFASEFLVMAAGFDIAAQSDIDHLTG